VNGVVLLTHETGMAAIDESAPAPVISAALTIGSARAVRPDFADKLLSAMRYGFGGHARETTTSKGGPG